MNRPGKLAERRPYRECRKATSYKEASDSEEDDFQDADSSLNQTLEPENIEDEKRLVRSRPVGKRLLEVTEELAGCKLDGSAIVFEESDDETDSNQNPEKVHPLGPEVEESEIVIEGHIQVPSVTDNLQENLVRMVNYDKEDGVDEDRAM